MLSAQVPYGELSDAEFMTLCRVLTRNGVARLFDIELSDIDRRERLISKALKDSAGPVSVPAEDTDQECSVLEAMHEQCRRFVRQLAGKAEVLGMGREDLIQNIRQMRDIASAQKVIDDAVESYSRTAQCMETLFEPLRRLDKSTRDMIVSAWREKSEMRLMMRK